MVIDKNDKESTGPSSSAKDKGRTQSAKHTERHLAVLLNGPGRVVRDAGLGKDLHEIPICITGAWVKGGRKFAIDARDLAAMVRNFSKRRNEQVVIDYEHASEQPEVAQGGPIPAAGWIHELQVSGPRCQVLGEPETRNPSLRARRPLERRRQRRLDSIDRRGCRTRLRLTRRVSNVLGLFTNRAKNSLVVHRRCVLTRF